MIDLDLIARSVAYEAPLYQVLALPQGPPYTLAPNATAPPPTSTPPPPGSAPRMAQPVSIAQLLNELEHRRDRL